MRKAFIDVSVDVNSVKDLFNKLEPKKQNWALKKAQNEAAKEARKELARRAEEIYTVKNAGFNREMKIRTRSGKFPAAVIYSSGEPLPLRRFKYSKGKKVTKVQVLKQGGMKTLAYPGSGIKGFVNNIARKGQVRKRKTSKGNEGTTVRHLAVAQRTGRERLEIREKFSNSIPIMLGSPKYVYGVVEPHIGNTLTEYLEKFIRQALGE